MSSKQATVTPFSALGGGTEHITLLEMEGKGMFLMAPGVNTVTFYRGDVHAAAAFLRARLLAVWQKNKWLGATIVKDKAVHKKLASLRYSTEVCPLDAMFVHVEDATSPLAGLSADTPYKQLVKVVCSHAEVPSGTVMIKSAKTKGAHIPISKLTVAPGPTGSNSFTVILSISHIACDGASYYQVLKQLSTETEEIATLNAKRNQAEHNKIPGMVGEKVYKSSFNAQVIFNALGEVMCGKKIQMFCFYVDDAKMAAAKAEALVDIEDPPAYVSSNDVLTSSFANTCQPYMLLMAITFRGKIEAITLNDMGNYHNGLVYDKSTYSSPALIRKSLQGPAPMSRVKLPGFWKGSRCRRGLISNWATLNKKGLVIPECEQILHIPVAKIEEQCLDTAIVFQAQPGKTAVLFFAKNADSGSLVAGMPLGQPVSPTMFAQ